MSTSRVTTRVATTEDLPGILRLYEQLAVGRGNALPADSTLADERFKEMRQQHGRTVLVALIDGTVRGTVDVLVVPNLTHHGMPWAIVENVIVDTECRRQGIGRALMDRVHELADRAGCYKIQLLSRKRRSEAHAFYASCGYDPVAEGFRQYLE